MIFVKCKLEKAARVSRELESSLREGQIGKISNSPAWGGVEYPEKSAMYNRGSDAECLRCVVLGFLALLMHRPFLVHPRLVEMGYS